VPKLSRLFVFTLFALVITIVSVGVDARRVAAVTGATRPNAGFNANSQPANDDSNSILTSLGFTINYFGASYSQVYVNTNGNITFDGALGTYTPFPLTSTGVRIIAPFFADVDTRAGNLVKFGTDTVDGRPAFGVNWIDVGYYLAHTDKLNSFQLVIIDRSDIAPGEFDFEFNYDAITWETGDASGGVNGFGGASARVGYSNGSGAPGSFAELAGSAINGALLNGGPNALVNDRLNTTQLARYLFQVRGGSVLNAPAAPIARACAAGPTADSVVGSLPFLTQIFYEPGKLSPGLFIEPGTYWVLGMDESASFYKIILSCEYIWVPIDSMGPNYDATWMGRPLPTGIVTATSNSSSK